MRISDRMKRVALMLFIVFASSATINAQIDYESYFTDKVLRFDYLLAGNHKEIHVYPISLKEEPIYGGSKTNLIDIFNYGNLRYELYDVASNGLIYSRGFCTLYQEWQTTIEAQQMNRTFHEVATMPYPISSVRFVLLYRERNGTFSKIYETIIDPTDYRIIHESTVQVKYSKIFGSRLPSEACDIVFIAEGYTANEMSKFRNDVKTMTEIMFSEYPFNEHRDKFNIWAVESESIESGTDIPGDGVYKNTILNSSFYTFDIERYITTFDLKAVNDYAAVVPHDNIVILVNTSKYGGGGFYNYYSISVADNYYSNNVFVHEIGHSLFGLADEYYTSDVPYQDYYPLDVEPWEPNITTRSHFETKWSDMIKNNVAGVGLIEGAGYSAKGIFRASEDCTMKSNSDAGFCPVCSQAILKMIDFYCK